MVGEVGDDELLLFGVDCAPGAIDMRGPRCAPLEELLEGDWLLVEGADEVADRPFVDGAGGVAELDGGVELDEDVELDDGVELDDDWLLADDGVELDDD